MQNSQRQLLTQQISLLKLQISEQQKRQQKLKELLTTFTTQLLSHKEIQQQNEKLTALNQKLLDGLKQLKQRHGEEVKYYDGEIGRLKAELNEKINDIERVRVEGERKGLGYEEKIGRLQAILEKKCGRIGELQRRVHEGEIGRLREDMDRDIERNGDKRTERNSGELAASTLRILHIDNESQNNMRASNISSISRSSKVSEYLKMDKSQMKIMMSALLRSKRQLQRTQMGGKSNKTMLS